MSYGVAANTRIAGATDGTFLDDLTTIGQWPKTDNIVRITRVVVNSGAIIDSVTITYATVGGGSQTVTHGGPGGGPSLTFDLADNQTITAVYGRRLNNTSLYGNHNIVQLSFVVATMDPSATGPATSTVQSTSAGLVSAANTQFQFTWPLAGATSYTFQPSGQTISFLQGLGFTQVFAQAGGPL